LEQVQPKLTAGDVLSYVLAYMCWLLTAALSMATLFMVRTALNVAWPVMVGTEARARWALRAIDRFSLVLLGLVWLVYVIFVEQYYRSSITEVRTRRYSKQTRPTPRAEPAPKNGLMRFLRRLGLDILARRLVPTMGIPLAVLGVSYLIYQLSFVLLAR
jgi:hypothetical protein